MKYKLTLKNEAKIRKILAIVFAIFFVGVYCYTVLISETYNKAKEYVYQSSEIKSTYGDIKTTIFTFNFSWHDDHATYQILVIGESAIGLVTVHLIHRLGQWNLKYFE